MKTKSAFILLLCAVLVHTKITAQVATESRNSGNAVNTTVANLDTLYNNGDIIAFGNCTKPVKEAISYVATKFRPYVLFSDFQTKPYKGRNTQLDYSSNMAGKRYKAIITEAYSKGVNFAGHYCFVKCACSPVCRSSVVVDVHTGKIYDGVSAGLNYKYENNSRLLIVNPPDTGEYYLDCANCAPQVYVWNEKLKKFEQRT